MKNLCFFFLLFSALLQRAQLTVCFPNVPTNTLSSNPVGARFPEYVPCNQAGDDEVYDYDANIAAVPTLTYNINFVFLQHPTLPNSFTNLTLQQLTTDCDSTIAWINRQYETCGTTPSWLTPRHPSSYVTNPKIKLKRYNVYRETTTDAIGGWWNDPHYYQTFPKDTDKTVNIYFFADTVHPGGGVAFPGQFVNMAEDTSAYHTPHTPGDKIDEGLIWHELGHTLGFLSDHYLGDTVVSPLGPTQTVYPQSLRPNGYDSDPVLKAYTPSDAALDTIKNSSCTPASHPNNNNLMGNMICREVMSLRQIAAFHYLVAKGITKKYTQFYNTAYTYTPAIYTVTTLPTYSIATTQTLTGVLPFQTLVVMPGCHLTLQGRHVQMAAGAKIIVQPGGWLDLKCTKLETLKPNMRWYGIEVWGNYNGALGLLASGFNPNQGVVTMDNCTISNAQIGVLTGKRAAAFTTSIVPNSGGGIVIANNTKFVNNWNAVRMMGHAFGTDTSYFSSCTFSNSVPYGGPNCCGYTNSLIQLENVFAVKFYNSIYRQPASTSTTGASTDTSFCINGYNCCIKVQGPGSSFSNAFYGIYIMNGIGNLIQDNTFSTRNGIYISNSAFDKIVRNPISVNGPNTADFTNSLRTGLYMNQCTNYKIEKNIFTGNTSPTTIEEGICINNSGPISTKVYNNTFSYLHQGLWAQNQNYDPANPGIGLIMNCNIFSYCDYDIGVQTPLVSCGTYTVATYVSTNWQYNFSQTCYNGGIGKIQGVTSGTVTTNARNTYTNETSTGNENKFYSFTPYSSPPQVNHGNFLGNRFHLRPQPANSDSNDVWDIGYLTGSAAPTNSLNYCPDNSPGPASRTAMDAEISAGSINISQMAATYQAHLDGGDTPGLLTGIHGTNAGASFFRDTLVSKAFLSDTVLLAYFSSPAVPMNYIPDVFVKNAPVNARIWKQLLDLELPSNIMDTLNAHQVQTQVNARDMEYGLLSLAVNDRAYAIAQKGHATIHDTTITSIKDSLAALIVLNGQGDIDRQLIELDIKFGDFTSASNRLNTYTCSNVSQQTKYIDFKTLQLQILQSSNGLQSLQSNSTWHDAIDTIASDWDHPCQQQARDLRFFASNVYIVEQKLQPQPADPGARHAQTSVLTSQSPQLLLTGIMLYPNPATDKLFARNLTNNDYAFSIVNVNGITLSQGVIRGAQVNEIDTHAFINGIYFVNLYDQHHVLVKSNKLIIVK